MSFATHACLYIHVWSKHGCATVFMARRRFFPSPETEAAQQLYLALIVAGIGITLIGIFTTSYLAIAEGASAPFEDWLSGQSFF